MEDIRKIRGDRVIWGIVILLSVFSLLAVYSASSSLAFGSKGGNTEFYLIKHGMILILGLGLMYLTHKIPYRYFSKASLLGMYIAVPLLAFTLLSGSSVNEAKRWVLIPWINLTFQSSDLAKLILFAFMARLLYTKRALLNDFRKGFLVLLIPVGLVCMLIVPANFSTAILIFMVCFVMMFVGRVPLKFLGGLAVLGIIMILLLLLIGKHAPNLIPRAATWVSRIENFSDNDKENDYQAEQSKIAIATGGFFGKLPGKSTQRNFLPSAYSDFIFAIIIEEYGLLGGAFLILLYMTLLFRGIRIALQADHPFGVYLATGITFGLVFQAMLNMAVAVGLGPVTGQTLPMVSMGGTSVWFTSISVGMLLSISRNTETEESYNQVVEGTATEVINEEQTQEA
ncbi:MAG: FtsW/RodA/SpoVE family cell cycle protein [Bacteroidales bacterium]|nr:FtsW/RodA/SpoVE family cell cycle protein [Bacteroidales bacterium]